MLNCIKNISNIITLVKILFMYGIPCVNLVSIHGHEGHTKENGH